MNRVSVVLASYQGERFVGAQLASILAQSCPPDEVIVSDDGSTDATVPIVRDLAASTPVPVTVLIARGRSGVAANLSRGLGLARGDVIAFADQDDVWEPGKLARQLEVLEATGAAAVFSDAAVVDAAGRAEGRRLWEAVGFDPRRQVRWEVDPLGVLLQRPVLTGATVLVRTAALGATVLPFPPHAWHDAWLALLLAGSGQRMVALPELLLRYRLHERNAAGLPPTGLLRARSQPAAWADHGHALVELRRARDRLATLGVAQTVLARLDRAADFRGARLALPAHRWSRWAPVARRAVAGDYGAFANGWRSVVADLLLVGPPPTGPEAASPHG
ncbi:MAG TPA: glycosyltransferase [Mycobacteriales bacterium]|nr:glycosyltransferase [Mycobacteriales bacterium]